MPLCQIWLNIFQKDHMFEKVFFPYLVFKFAVIDHKTMLIIKLYLSAEHKVKTFFL